MGSSDWRRNTLVGVFPQQAPIISASEIHRFVFKKLELKIEDVEVLQLEPGLRRFYIKLRSVDKFMKIQETNFYEFECRAGKVNITLSDARGIGGKILRIFRLPFEMTEREVSAALAPYGTVEAVTMEKWTNYELKGVYNGIRNVKINLRKHVPSYLSIQGVESLILYDGQPKTCRKCHEEGHLYIECQQRSVNKRRWETARGGDVTTQPGAPDPPAEKLADAASVVGPLQQPASQAASREAASAATGAGGSSDKTNNNKKPANKSKNNKPAADAKPSTSDAEQGEDGDGGEWTTVGENSTKKRKIISPAAKSNSDQDDSGLTKEQQKIAASILDYEYAKRKNTSMELIAEIDDHVRAGKNRIDWLTKIGWDDIQKDPEPTPIPDSLMEELLK